MLLLSRNIDININITTAGSLMGECFFLNKYPTMNTKKKKRLDLKGHGRSRKLRYEHTKNTPKHSMSSKLVRQPLFGIVTEDSGHLVAYIRVSELVSKIGLHYMRQ